MSDFSEVIRLMQEAESILAEPLPRFLTGKQETIANKEETLDEQFDDIMCRFEELKQELNSFEYERGLLLEIRDCVDRYDTIRRIKEQVRRES